MSLTRLGVISSNEPVLHPKAQVQDLVALLRDGVVLCQLVHSVDPELIDLGRVIVRGDATGDMREVDDFLCRNNIFLFLHACVQVRVQGIPFIKGGRR